MENRCAGAELARKRGVPRLSKGVPCDYTRGKSKDKEIQQLRHENEALREGSKQALMAIDFLQAWVQELEQQKARDSHNSHLPYSYIL